MASKKAKLKRGTIPKDGVLVSASEGKEITRIHLDLADDGITLAMVGAASAGALSKESRHQLLLKEAEEGITLAVVGAAVAPN